MEEKFWTKLKKWLEAYLKAYMDSFMNAFINGKVFAKAVVRVLTHLDGQELSQVRERLAPTSEERLQSAARGDIPAGRAEEALICALRDKSCLLELLKDPDVAAVIARLTPRGSLSKRRTWADQAREGIKEWMEKVADKPRKRLETILRIAEETDGWPSRDLVTSMLAWRDFSESDVRRWLSRPDSNGVTQSVRPTTSERRAELPKQQSSAPRGVRPQRRRQPPAAPENYIGSNLDKDERHKLAGKASLTKVKIRGLGPKKLEDLGRAGITTVGQLAAATEKDVADQIGLLGRKAFKGFVAEARKLIEETANGGQ